jgi:hypothetical protein
VLTGLVLRTLLGAARVHGVVVALEPNVRLPLLLGFGSGCVKVLLEVRELLLEARDFRLVKFGVMVHLFCMISAR